MARSTEQERTALGFASRWDLRATMVFERVYHPNLRMSLGDKRALLEAPGALGVWMYDIGSRALVGETYGEPLRAALADGGEGASDLKRFAHDAAFYVSSTTVLPKFHGRGYGTILKAYFLGRAAQAGYRIIVGHAREGASCALNVRFGAALGKRYPSWAGTGDSYRFYVLRLG